MKQNINETQDARTTQHPKKKYHRRQQRKLSGCALQPSTQSYAVQSAVSQRLSMSSSESSSTSIKKKLYSLQTELNLDPTVFLTDYCVLSNDNFKAMLSNVIVSSDMGDDVFNRLLEIEEFLPFTHQLTQLVDKFAFLQLQEQQWTYFYQLGTNEGIWNGHVPRRMALVNSMCSTYGRSKLLIEQRRRKYERRLQQIRMDIDEYLKRVPSSITNPDQLVTIMHDLVHKEQYELRLELERRRHALKFHAQDHRLVHAFYNLKPRQTEVGKETTTIDIIHFRESIFVDTLSTNYLESH
jgi:hypothetical protein